MELVKISMSRILSKQKLKIIYKIIIINDFKELVKNFKVDNS